MKKVLFILAAILAAAVWYIYHDPQLSREIKTEVNQLLPEQQKSTTVYKWRDKQGNWQITDYPPPTGIKYETLEYRNNTNVMPSEAVTGQNTD